MTQLQIPTVEPAPQAPLRPSQVELIDSVAAQYRVSRETAARWLRDAFEVRQ